MANTVERSCTMLIHFDKGASSADIKASLEGSDVYNKIKALQKAIVMLLNGESLPSLFITIVRYVLPSEDHTVQKLLLLYLHGCACIARARILQQWEPSYLQETIEKRDANGKLLPEMILICQNLRNNLQHPNEYIRGATLRFLCRIGAEEEIFEPLIPSIMSCMEHRNAFVRKNAVLAILYLYSSPNGEHLLQDAPELIENLLSTEQDLTTKRNAFQVLCRYAQPKALNYLLSHIESVAMWGDILQMAALELIRKVCRSNPGEKGNHIKVILALLQSSSTAAVYECAVTLVSLSQTPTAIRAAANCYAQMLTNQSDSNVKLIVLERLEELKDSHPEIMQELLMDILRTLSTPIMDIQKKTLEIALDLITVRNIDEVVTVLKREVMRTQSKELERAFEYRQLLVQAIHKCAIKFPDVAGNVLHLLMDFLGDANTASALDVVFFVREILETSPQLQETILARLIENFRDIRSSRVCSCALWILGEYCNSKDDILAAIEAISGSVGDNSLLAEFEAAEERSEGAGKQQAHRPAVLADGSYATQTALADTTSITTNGTAAVPNIRALLLAGDYFVGGVLSAALTKLHLRLRKMTGKQDHQETAQCMSLIAGIVLLGQDSRTQQMDADSLERIANCLRVLGSRTVEDSEIEKIWLELCHESFKHMIQDKLEREAKTAKLMAASLQAQPDELIDFSHLKSNRGLSQLELEDEVATDLKRATGLAATSAKGTHHLNRVLQLTGFSDPVYAETYVTVHQYDIVLDCTIINKTNETLQNVCLELATMGDLKLVDRPHNYTLGPGATSTIRANIKVSSTETGAIFGNIVYESGNDRKVVVLNDVHIDIMDYISPASCADVQFRSMWAEFEWENKVAVNTSYNDESAFLDHIVASTNMKCLTPPSARLGDCGFLAANLYAKSVFGEDALVNVSVEKQADGRLAGFIRIRSKTQGIALSLGDKLIVKQRL